MKFKKNIELIILLLVTAFFLSCTDKFDISEIDTGDGDVNIGGDTVYVEVTPEWGGFNRPQDVMVGREPFIYVADTDNNRIVMMNLNGQILGIRSMQKPMALAQDYKLNLIVCAQFDTVVSGESRTFSAVYKLDLVSVSHQIAIAPITRLLPRANDLNRPLVEYTGACVFFNNMFYVSRKGPNNSSFVDPDNSLLIFIPKSFINSESEGDTLVGRVPNIDPLGQGPVSAYDISSLASFNNQSVDIIITLTGGTSFKANWLHYQITPIDQKYVSNFSPGSGTDLVIPNSFERPEGCALDNSGNIYIADAGKDSVYKFNSFGDELNSFGGPDVFNEPYGVAFFNKTLYVADTGNNRILRFILSTEIQ
jgi:hypothetical protein